MALAPSSVNVPDLREGGAAHATVLAGGKQHPVGVLALSDGTLVDGANPLPVSATLTGTVTIDSIFTDDAAFTVATSKVMAMGAVNTTDQVDVGDVGAVGMTQGRALFVNLQNGSGSETGLPGTPLWVQGAQSEDGPASSGDRGLGVLFVRNDAGASQTNADGDYGFPAIDAAGRVGITDLGGSITVDGTVAATQSGSWTVDTELPTAAALADNVSNPTVPSVGVYVSGYDASAGEWDRIRSSAVNADGSTAHAQGVLDVRAHLAFLNGSGTWDRARGTIADGLLVNLGSNNDVTVTGSVTADTELPAAAALANNTATPTAPAVGAFLMLFDGTTWDMAGKALDEPLSAGNVGIPAIGVRNDSETTVAGANFDAIFFSGDLKGNMRVVGNLDHDAVDRGSPLKIGGKVNTTEVPTAVANADRTDAHFDDRGRQGVFVTGFGGKAVDVEDDDQSSVATGLNVQPLVKRGTLTTMMSAQAFNDTNTGTEVDGSTTLDTTRGDHVELFITLDSEGTGTHYIQFYPQFSPDGGTTWYALDETHMQAVPFEDTEVATAKNKCYLVPVVGKLMKFTGIATNATSTNTFTLTAKAVVRTNP